MAKFCENCEKKLSCYFRGIQNPCQNWEANPQIKRLSKAAKKIVDKQLSFEEKRFVVGCTTLSSFSPKQELWLTSLLERHGVTI